MLNVIWLAFILIAIVVGGLQGNFDAMTKGAFEAAEIAVMKIALPLVGLMAIWLGIMRLAERSGLVQVLARGLRPLLRRLFPDVPADHPAHGAMVMNMAANMLGLGNAATPLGLRAMALLNQLNPRPGTATNAMCTFLTLNTASIQLVPTTAIALMAVAGAAQPAAFVPAAIMATFIALTCGLLMCKFLERLPAFRFTAAPEAAREAGPQAASPETTSTAAQTEVEKIEVRPLAAWHWLALAAFAGLFAYFFTQLAFFAPPAEHAAKPLGLRAAFAIAVLAVPFLLGFFPLYAALRGVKVYEQFVEGARESFGVAQRIIPFLVAMLVAIRLLRDSGAIAEATRRLAPALDFIGLPADLLPMVLMRPLSGSASQGIFVELIDRLGADDLVSRMAATIYGSTETTFYVLAVYFGSVSVRQTRHAVIAGLTADVVAFIAAIFLCRMLFT
jgi:spore maturation protein SpmA